MLMIVAISGCTSVPNTANTKTYSNNSIGISFQYPPDWNIYQKETHTNWNSWSENNKTASDVAVFVEKGNTDLETRKNITLDYINSYNSDFGGSIRQNQIKIAGGTGYRIDASLNETNGTIYQSHMFFVKNDTMYTFLFTTKSLTAIESNINTIVNSFQTT